MPTEFFLVLMEGGGNGSAFDLRIQQEPPDGNGMEYATTDTSEHETTRMHACRQAGGPSEPATHTTTHNHTPTSGWTSP